MKKLVFLFVMTAFAAVTKGQNVQLHYDMGDDRGYFTSTVEMFKPDSHGSSFFFIDMDYSEDGVQNAYFEIARDLNFWQEKTPLSLHVEYNGGFFIPNDTDPDEFGNYDGQKVNNAYLLGASYGFNNEDFSKGITFQAMYKYIQKNVEPNNFQLTAVWYMHFFDRKLSFTGFADFWREKHTVSNDGFQTHVKEADYVFLTEPQIWYNFNEHFSAGSEIELSNNFAGMDGFKVKPTVAVKYNF